MNKRKGFTMVELLVSMSLFVIVISITSGVFIRSLRTQRISVALIAANSNVSLAIEQMAREMRTGQNFSVSGGSEISFTNASGEAVVYRLANSAIERRIGTGDYKKITASNVVIENLNFTLLSDSSYSPRITITIGVSPANVSVSGIVINLQTTVSSRIIGG